MSIDTNDIETNVTETNVTETSFIAAAVQFEPRFGDVASNVERSCRYIDDAAALGARLVVLPEACSTGYVFDDAAEAGEYAEDVPFGPACTAWQERASALSVHVVAGVVERAGDDVFNSAVLIGPHGHIGTFRKVHLWNEEKRIFAPGDLGFPAFDTELGRIGVHICYDEWFPESCRTAALGGADVICVPANWVPVPTQPAGYPAFATMLTMTAAHTSQVYFVAASRIGVERGQPFIGRSLIVDHTGTPLAGPAGDEEEVLLHARIDPIGSRDVRRNNPFNRPLHDRRPDAYRAAPLTANQGVPQ